MSSMPGKTPKTNIILPQKDDGNTVVLERRTQRTQPPQMYQVVMLNDDFTPMEFVVMVLQEFFNKDRESATQIMLKIHLDGKGIAGCIPRTLPPPRWTRCGTPPTNPATPCNVFLNPLNNVAPFPYTVTPGRKLIRN